MVPDYQSLMLPLLQALADGQTYRMRDIENRLAITLGLSPEDLAATISSGGNLFSSRVGWARTYLKKAKLIEQPKRGMVVITERGKNALRSNPRQITNQDLKQFPEFVDFVQSGTQHSGDNFPKNNLPVHPLAEDIGIAHSEYVITDRLSPQERIAQAQAEMHAALADEMMEKILSNTPKFFEQLVVDLLVKMGYGGTHRDAARVVGQSGDEGIDGIINQDRLGLDVIYVQAKRYAPDRSISRPDLQQFVGALVGKGAGKGIFITTSKFTRDARDFRPANTKLILIDGQALTQYCIDYGVGCTTEHSFEIKRLDSDYFAEGEG